MKGEETDKFLLLAQMVAEEDPHPVRNSLNSNLPLVLIVFVGAFVVVVAILATQQWSQHVERTLTEKVERIYVTQIQNNLDTIKQNANSVAGFIRASEFITKQEFEIFSDSLKTRSSSSNFVYMKQHRDVDYRYLVASSDVSTDAINKMILSDEIVGLLAKSVAEPGGRYVTSDSEAGEFVLYYLPVNATKQSTEEFVLYGLRVNNLVNSDDLGDQYAQIRLYDQDSPDLIVNLHSGQRGRRLSTFDMTVDNLEVFFNFGVNTHDLIKYDYFKWFLIGFSLIFTVLLCAQIVAAKRAIRKLGNLAVQRTNDLSTINTELAEEIVSRTRFQAKLLEKNQEIEATTNQLEVARNQLYQQEKLASLGQMAAGVANEISNPIGFINSNLSMLKRYTERVLKLCTLLENVGSTTLDDTLRDHIRKQLHELKYDSMRKHMIPVIDESLEGADKINQMLQSLRDFSRDDEADWQWADIHAGIESMLKIAWSEIKYKAKVHREFGNLPKVECVPAQINQVIMNLLMNSVQAMAQVGNITIRTTADDVSITIEIQDDGCGIPDTIIGKIFDPFFTTKEAGRTTGLGLSIAYGIIANHQGEIGVSSVPGGGTTFVIKLPIRQNQNASDNASVA